MIVYHIYYGRSNSVGIYTARVYAANERTAIQLLEEHLGCRIQTYHVNVVQQPIIFYADVLCPYSNTA